MAFSQQRLAWLARWLQRRRRARRSVAVEPPVVNPNAPVITEGSFEWVTPEDPQWADTALAFTFEHGNCPVATLEVWLLNLEGGDGWARVATVPSTETGYRHEQATPGEAHLHYKIRYVNGGTVGPWSNEIEIAVML